VANQIGRFNFVSLKVWLGKGINSEIWLDSTAWRGSIQMEGVAEMISVRLPISANPPPPEKLFEPNSVASRNS
jgi:hypothetical protein